MKIEERIIELMEEEFSDYKAKNFRTFSNYKVHGRNVPRVTTILSEMQSDQGLLKYSNYLGFKHIEMYGINSVQLMDSDMITQTQYLHRYFEKTRPYIALENCGDGKFAMVSSEDEVFLYTSDSDVLEDTKQKLLNYILNRFQEINN